MEDDGNVDIRPLRLQGLQFGFMGIAHAQGLKLHSERHKLQATWQRIDRLITSDYLHLFATCMYTYSP